MNNDDKNEDEDQLEIGTGESWDRRDNNLFDNFDTDDEFEESDRDSDFAAVFTEVEEVEADLPEEETLQPAEESWTPFNSEQPSDQLEQPSYDNDTEEVAAPLAAEETEPEEAWEDDEDEYYEEEVREINLPVGIIVVGIVALVLLGAGGYGVMQDRAALQEEIRQLQATLATTASPREVAETRAAAETSSSRSRELEQQLAQLSRENRSLQAIVGGLETQLHAQQDALAKPKAPPAAPIPSAKPKPAAPAKAQAVPPATGTWFVNFGSYSQRATAESWAKRLQPGAGEVVVTTGDKDGRTFYRVRVINLASKDIANSTARKLEQKYELSKLWVGRTS